MNGIWRCGWGDASAVGSVFHHGGCAGGIIDTVYFLKSFYTYIKLGNNSEASRGHQAYAFCSSTHDVAICTAREPC